MNLSYKYFLSCVIFFGLIISSCKQETKDQDFIAKVGNSILTYKDIEFVLGPDLDKSNPRFQAYINRWIETELLYQEAMKKGTTTNDEIEKQLLEVRRQLAVQYLINNEIYSDSTELSEAELKSYFDSNSQEFIFREDAVRLNYASFDQRSIANDFRPLILKDKTWSEAIIIIQEDADKLSSLKSNVVDNLFTQNTLFPGELWKIVQHSTKGDISFPVKAGDNYFVVQVIEKYPKGTIAHFEAVKNEVKIKALMDKRRRKYDNYISNLKNKYPIELRYQEKHTKEEKEVK